MCTQFVSLVAYLYDGVILIYFLDELRVGQKFLFFIVKYQNKFGKQGHIDLIYPNIHIQISGGFVIRISGLAKKEYL